MKPSRRPLAHRLTALLLAVVIGGALGVGAARPWHRHLLAGLQLFHSHSHLGSHHHQELHALAASAGRVPAEHAHPHQPHGRAGEPRTHSPGSDESEDDPRPESDCALLAGGLTTLARSSADFAAPVFVVQRRDEPRAPAFRPREPAAHRGARAPPV